MKQVVGGISGGGVKDAGIKKRRRGNETTATFLEATSVAEAESVVFLCL